MLIIAICLATCGSMFLFWALTDEVFGLGIVSIFMMGMAVLLFAAEIGSERKIEKAYALIDSPKILSYALSVSPESGPWLIKITKSRTENQLLVLGNWTRYEIIREYDGEINEILKKREALTKTPPKENQDYIAQ